MNSTNMKTFALLANLSISVSSEDRLLEALNSYFSWGENSNEDPGLKAVVLRSPTQAIVYIENSTAMNKLLSPERVPLSGPLSANFSQAANFPTEVICVLLSESFNGKLYETITRIVKDTCPGSHPFLVRNKSVLMRLPTAIFAVSVTAAIERSKANLIGVSSARVIRVGDHVCLECIWRGNLPLRDAIIKLTRLGLTLTTVVQSALSLWEEQPLVLAAKAKYNSTSSDQNEMLLICCTEYDADIISAASHIELNGDKGRISVIKKNDSLTYNGHYSPNISSVPLHSSSSGGTNASYLPLAQPTSSKIKHQTNFSQSLSLNNSSHIYNHSSLAALPQVQIYWDIENCPLQITSGNVPEDEVSTILNNMLMVALDYIGVEKSSTVLSGLICNKFVFLARDSADFTNVRLLVNHLS